MTTLGSTTAPVAGRTGALLGRAVVGGIIGGVVVDAFLLLSHRASYPQMYEYIASGIAGKAALGNASYVWLGIVMHFVISIVWALLYAFAAIRGRFVHRWLLGAVGLGIVVALGMQAVTAAAGLSHGGLHPIGLVISMLTHIVFFALPITGYLALAARGDLRQFR